MNKNNPEIDEDFAWGMKKFFGVTIKTKDQERKWIAAIWWGIILVSSALLQLCFGCATTVH